jgi:hypothetical protein
MLFTHTIPVHPKLVEGCIATPFLLRQAQHERLSLHRPCNDGRIRVIWDLRLATCTLWPVTCDLSLVYELRSMTYELFFDLWPVTCSLRPVSCDLFL